MDIITSCKSTDDKCIFNDVIQNPARLNSSKEHINKEVQCSNTDSDALLAVKMDPAVLEAQVTVGTSQADTGNASYASSFVDNSERMKQRKDVKQETAFERAMSMQQAALFSLSPSHFNLLLSYVDTLRRQRNSLQKQMECAFCKNNDHPEVWYSTHQLKDSLGRVRCPILRTYSCRRCGATGDNAHTIRYCPEN